MAYILKQMAGGYQYLFEDVVDPRAKEYPIAGKPIQLFIILLIYYKFVIYWGPQWMKNRQPFNLDKIIMAFDLMQIFGCGYVFIKGATIFFTKFKWICQPIGLSNSEEDLTCVKLVYCYFLLKLADLLDTVFFILRKKDTQISFLHVFHHTMMVLASWVGICYLAGGHGMFVGVINCFVHVVMYFYYFLTMAMPEIKQSLWWKKYITQLQIIQFLILIVHMSSLLFVQDCEYPRWVAFVFVPNDLFMLLLFADFYIKAYIKKPKQKTSNEDKTPVNDFDLRRDNLNITNSDSVRHLSDE